MSIIQIKNTTVGLNQLVRSTQFVVSPNPFTSNISVALKKQSATSVRYLIRNNLGQLLFSKQGNNFSGNDTEKLDLSFLPKGIYLLEVITDTETLNAKIIKQ